MIILEERITQVKNNLDIPVSEKYVGGYFLTIDDLTRLVRDFQADCHDGFVSNDISYIELWLKKHDQI